MRSAVVFSETGVQAGMGGTGKPLSLARCKYCVVPTVLSLDTGSNLCFQVSFLLHFILMTSLVSAAVRFLLGSSSLGNILSTRSLFPLGFDELHRRDDP